MKKALSANSCFYFCLMLSVIFCSCGKNRCKDVVCSNDGFCVNGKCACAPGYEGENCDIEWHRRYTGTWQVADTLAGDTSGAKYTYEIQVKGGAEGGVFVMNNFSGAGVDSVVCDRVSKTEFTIRNTIITGGIVDTVRITNGKGTIDTVNNVVRASYSIENHDTAISRHSIWHR